MTICFFTFSVCVRGKSSSGQTVNPRMRCCSASCPLAQATASSAAPTASSDSSRSSAAWTSTAGPCCNPTTAASLTFGCLVRMAWMSSGKTFWPLGRTIMSFFRPFTCRNPSSSKKPRSPVRYHSPSNTAAVSSGARQYPGVMLSPRAMISPSPLIFTSTLGSGRPVESNRRSWMVWLLMTGAASVVPYPWMIFTPSSSHFLPRS